MKITTHINHILKKFCGYQVISSKNFERLKADASKLNDRLNAMKASLDTSNINLLSTNQQIEVLQLISKEDIKNDLKIFCASNLLDSKSQLLQDLIALYLKKTPGFFCEVGAADGYRFSNTYLLEKNHHWTGILVEPAQCFREQLVKNRNCNLSFNCISNSSGTSVIFNETEDPFLSTIDSYSSIDIHTSSRTNGRKYEVETITLIDLLKDYSAPSFIDYLSIDTEGSEYSILKDFDFDQYSFGFISIEHNFGETRDQVNKLLVSNGYEQIMPSASKWDDYYVKSELLSRIFFS